MNCFIHDQGYLLFINGCCLSFCMKLESHEFNVMDVVTISIDDIILQMMVLQGVNDIQTSEYICI